MSPAHVKQLQERKTSLRICHKNKAQNRSQRGVSSRQE